MDEQLSDVGGKVWLFHIKSSRRARGSLSFNIIREICSYFEAALLLCQVTSTFLHSFNCQTSTWGLKVSLCTHILADSSSRWVMLEDGQVLCSGGGKD